MFQPARRAPFPLLRTCLLAAAVSGLAGCASSARLPVSAGTGPNPTLPPPERALIPVVHVVTAKGWPEGTKPVAASGTAVAAFAEGLDHPRWLYVLPNGDVLVAETNAPPRPADNKGIKGFFFKLFQKKAGGAVPSANRITLLRDADGGGVAETRSVFLSGLNSPFGMTLVGDTLYVANSDAVVKFPYEEGETRIAASGTRVAGLPAGPRNHHWTKNVIASPDGTRLYVAIGSNSNVAEHGMEEEERAAIWEVDAATGRHRVFASGLRNPVGMAWEPESGALWTAVNERDELGSDLVPDYALGPHTASLGLAHSEGTSLPGPFRSGMFVGQHGSWNRKPRSGYKVVFVPFTNGKPSGEPLDVLTGFVKENGGAMGRPVGVAIDKRGALLVADDVGNVIWRVTAAGGAAAAR